MKKEFPTVEIPREAWENIDEVLSSLADRYLQPRSVFPGAPFDKHEMMALIKAYISGSHTQAWWTSEDADMSQDGLTAWVGHCIFIQISHMWLEDLIEGERVFTGFWDTNHQPENAGILPWFTTAPYKLIDEDDS